MKRTSERRAIVALWALHVTLSVAGLAILAEALFVPRHPGPAKAVRLPAPERPSSLPQLPSLDGLEGKRMSRAIQGRVAPPQAKAANTALESLIRLAGILDFGGKQPSLAIIETLPQGESKAYRMGDKVAETGAVIHEIGQAVIVEYAGRRYRLSPSGIQEVPARALGTAGSFRVGD